MFNTYELKLIDEALYAAYVKEVAKREKQGLYPETINAQLHGLTELMLKVSKARVEQE
jgi:hypothetical protein